LDEIEKWSNPRPVEIIQLSIEAFKMWAMMAGTPQGKQVRLYFLECEKIAKQKSKTSPPSSLDILEGMVRQLREIDNRQQEDRRRIDAIEQQTEDAIADLKQLPPATVEPAPLTTQFALSRLVRAYAIANSLPFQDCWERLHLEYRDRVHIDLRARGRNHKPKISGVLYAQKYGQIEDLYAIAIDLFGQNHPHHPHR
jgi:hypothetical protein